MFYDENRISTTLNCTKCNERLDDPRILPCGDTICSRCQSSIHVNKKKFKSILCNKTHSMPDEGLPLSKALQALLLLQPSAVNESPSVESFRKELNVMRKRSLHFRLASTMA